MPAEWEVREAVWLAWPVREETWPGPLKAAVRCRIAAYAALLSRYGAVNILCPDSQQTEANHHLQACNADAGNIRFHNIPYDDVWLRDSAPTFVEQEGNSEAVCWRFNAWGGKYPCEQDARLAPRIAEAARAPVREIPLTCEGGAIESDGTGTILTTESVLLNPNRNPDCSREEVERLLREALGAETVRWFPRGLARDDTDGHIDMFCRFFAPDGILLAQARPGDQDNDHRLEEAREQIEEWRTPAGGRYQIVRMELPEPVPPPAGWRAEQLPGTYLNFFIFNQLVVLPDYGNPKADANACGLLGELFPDHRITSIPCREILVEGGALHCLVQQH